MLLETKYAQLDQESDLLPVAIRTMTFKMRGFRRSVARQRLADKPPDDLLIADTRSNPREELEKKQFKERLDAAVCKLGDRCRRIWFLRLDGCRMPEIAETLGASNMQQLYTWIFRCNAELKKLLAVGAEAA